MDKKELKNYAFIDSQNLNMGILRIYKKAPHKDETLRGAFSCEFYNHYSTAKGFVNSNFDKQF